MRFQDAGYLQKDQYRNPANLNARVRLHQQFSTNPQGIHAWMLAIIRRDLSPSASILELGCGDGQLWRSASPIPAGWQAALTDFSSGMASNARSALEKYASQLRFTVSDAQQIPFPAGHFDAVFAHFMLYHVPDLPRVLSEARRVLKPGGRLFAATVGRGHMKELYDLAYAFKAGSIEAPSEFPFNLENGGGALEAFFNPVTIEAYEDSIVVNQARPIVDYIYSMASFDGKLKTEAGREALREFIEDRLASAGPLHVTKRSGMFLAQRPPE